MISAALSILKSDTERKIVSEIYNANSKRFYSIAYSRLKNKTDSEDAVQEAFLRIATNPETFFKVPDNKKVAFIDVVVRNVAIEMFRKKTAVVEVEIEDDYTLDSCSIEDMVIGDISKEALVDYIKSMPDTQKDVLLFRVYNNLSNKEIAQMLNISETAARKRISDALKMIRSFVNGENNNE